MRNSRYSLLNVHELSPSYDNSLTFAEPNSQLNWFMQRVLYSFEDVQYLRKNRNVMVIPLHVDDISLCNYLMMINKNKYYYYFITNKEYMSENSSVITLKLDVIQTYLFDIAFGQYNSLIDRSHVNRYFSDGYPYVSNLMSPENLEVGEYMVNKVTTLYDYTNKGGYIVTSSDKLTASNGGSSSTGSGINNKLVSSNGFVFLKSLESLSLNAYDIGDGTRTIGYGITEVYQPTYFNKLYPTCTEESASTVLGEVLENFSKQVYAAMEDYGINMNNVKQQEFDAFVSFAYNSGIGGLKSSQIFIDYCNNVSRETIYNKWLTTNIMSGSQFEEGLKDRRSREGDIFLNGNYRYKLPINIVGGGTVTSNEGKGFIPSNYLQVSKSGSDIVSSARKLIGKPYVWGGNISPLGYDNGTDCSGLCQWTYNDNGIKISRTTYTQIYEGKEVLQDNIQLGDLIFSNFSSSNVPEHVFIYSGYVNNSHMCIEAPQEGQLIQERAFTFTNEMRIRRVV